MYSSVITISNILSNADKFESIGFSGDYNFEPQDAINYFDNLVLNAQSSPIFSGILLIEQQNSTYIIVDGLQRITTLCLLLFALSQSYKGTSEKNEIAGQKILENFLIHKRKAKLMLTGNEALIYEKIILAQDLSEEDKKSNLYSTYTIFFNKIKESKLSPNELYKAISSIKFMLILTDKTEISAREFYQVVNGKNDAQINLVSDFVKQIGEIAASKWAQIAELFAGTNKLFEAFVRDFLKTRLDEEILEKNSLYNNFKNYYHQISKYQDTKTIFESIYKYAQYYIKIINSDFKNLEIKDQFKILNKSQSLDAYPYLMLVVEDFEDGHINENAFINILNMINMFITSNTSEASFINFADLSKELNKMLAGNSSDSNLNHEEKLTINEINNLSKFEV